MIMLAKSFRTGDFEVHLVYHEIPKINAYLGKNLMYSGFQSFAWLILFNCFIKKVPKILKTCFPSNKRFFFQFLDLGYIEIHY